MYLAIKMPTPPIAKPIRTPIPKSNIIKMGIKMKFIKPVASIMIAAKIAPLVTAKIASFSPPSPWSVSATSSFTFNSRSTGIITVGPVTAQSVPANPASKGGKPMKKMKIKVINTTVVIPAIMVNRRI